MAEFTGGSLEWDLPDATLNELGEALENLATLAVQTMGPCDDPIRVLYDKSTGKLTVDF